MRRAAAVLALLLCACARLAPSEAELEGAPSPSYATTQAEVSVDVWQGFARLPAIPIPAAPHVDLVVDVTRSMQIASGDGLIRYYGARESAALLVERLPEEASVDVHVLGLARRSPCGEATRVASGPVSGLRELLPRRLRRVRPAGEGSLAGTLASIARARVGAEEETRVVAFTDLDESCGGDLCAAAQDLVASGARLELVLFGPAEPPACLDELTASSAPWVTGAEPSKPLPFRVEATQGEVEPERGRANGRPVAVPGAPAMLVVETDPPARIGPLDLRPGTRTRVWLLDFPTLQPPVREWHWSVQEAPTSPSAAAE